MAHFAEIDSNNRVLRVVVACNQDVANNGGEQSEQAAEHFKTIAPLSENGIKWVQTSYNNNFRKQFAGIGMIYDSIKDKFMLPQPYDSWSLNENDDWVSPIPYPETHINDPEGIIRDRYIWNEPEQRWDLINKQY